MTLIQTSDVEQGVWQVNPAIATGQPIEQLQAYALHYVRQLNTTGKYPLTIWPYHSMLGGIGHAIVPAVEEACFFHAMARGSQTRFEQKGSNPLTENYSALQPEVLMNQQQQAIAQKNTAFLQHLLEFDVILIAGQAKSHCVAWTIAGLLAEIQATNPAIAQKIYLLEDCTSPVVVPGVVDYTDQADASFDRFAKAGMQVVQSTDWKLG